MRLMSVMWRSACSSEISSSRIANGELTQLNAIWSIELVSQSAASAAGVPPPITKWKNRGPAERFLKLFGKPPRLTACECERTDETTLAQAFRMLSGDLVDGLLVADQNRLAGMTASELTPEQMVDELYWSALTRGPTEEDKRAAVAHISGEDDRRAALQDVTWALLNSAEFLLRR